MYNTMHYFTDLETIVDDVHGLFDRWEEQHTEREAFPIESLLNARVAIHEWIANLQRHARFASVPPRVGLCISPNGEGLACVIEDNSVGFDLDAYFEEHASITRVLPENGMGLHWIRSLAQNLRYQKAPGGVHQLAFYVAANQDSCLDIQFS